MKIFVLEDSEDRIFYFFQTFKEHEVVAVNSVEQARKILENTKFDYIFLDHDLGGQVFVDLQDKNCGSYVCKHMHETLNTDTPIIVHSWNRDGAMNMVSHLNSGKHDAFVIVEAFGTVNFVGIVNGIVENTDSLNKHEAKTDDIKSAYEIALGKL